MSALSYLPEGGPPFIVAATPIFTLAEQSDTQKLVFEVLEMDRFHLPDLLGSPHTFYFDRVFSGKLEKLEAADPLHPALRSRSGAVLRGVIRIYPAVHLEQ